MQPLTRHGHRGHAVFVLSARPRRAAAQDGNPIRRAKNARRRAAPPSPRLPRRREKVWPATRRAMPQADRRPPKRAPYGSHTAPVPAAKYSCWPRAATHRPARHISAHNPANRAKIGQHPTGRTAPAPPQKQSGSSAPPSQSARPRPYGRGARSPFVRFVPSSSMSRSAQSQRQTPHDRQNNSARPSARHIAAQSPVCHTPRPHRPACRAAKNAWASRHAGRTAPPRRENSPVSRTPHAAHHRPACRAAAKSPAKHPTGCAPSQNTRPPPVRAGGAFPFVRFVPSSENGRSAQSQRQAPHDRRSRSAAACQAARGRMNHSA